jgi:anti-sigma regulatory factor (Ser/Thr protein kinase)/anti-anti-sigma regulatory factor
MLTEIDDKQRVVVPTEILAQAAQDFNRQIELLLLSSPTSIALDCSALEHVSSKHVNYLWQARQRCEKAGVAVFLYNAPASLIRVLELLDLADFFPREKPDHALAVTDDFEPDANGIDSATSQFYQFIRAFELPALTLTELRTLFYEVATNIVAHAGLTADQRVTYTVRVMDPLVEVTFTDSGRPFDPMSTASDLDVREAAKRGQTRGFGLALIHKLADNISYKRKGGTVNELTITKRWK